MNNNEMLDCDVVRLDRLYEDFDNKADPFRAVVTWLCRPDFLPHNMKGIHGMEEEGVSPFNNKHEVVGEAREFEKDISAETIYFKCIVVTVGVNEDPVKFGTSQKKGPYPCYMQRFTLVKDGKKKFKVEPALQVSRKLPSKKKVLRSRSCSPVSPRVTPLRVNVAQLKLGKRKLSGTGEEGEKKRTRSCNSRETSPELVSSGLEIPSGVIGTPDGRSRRTPKPRKSMDYSSLVGLNERTRHKSTPGRVGNIVSMERFTQVETATGLAGR